MKVKGTYVVTDDSYELEIYYEYYWNDGDYEQPSRKRYGNSGGKFKRIWI